jgi:3-methyladenine DNA glycosylase AlkD
MDVHTIKSKLRKLANKKNAEIAQRFFKTGPGEYGEGDKFLGIRVPVLRKLAKEYQTTTVEEAEHLLKSPIHEERLLSLFILINIYSKGEEAVKKGIYKLYLNNSRFINNWDLVDTSAEHIVGNFLINKGKNPIYRLAKSEDLWERRISIISTFYFIKQGQYSETMKISKVLLHDNEDLIHKAVGWMLREVGKRNLPLEEEFLKKYYKEMPRTMLRYAIEMFPEPKRLRYLKGTI